MVDGALRGLCTARGLACWESQVDGHGKSVPYQMVAQVMGALNRGGFSSIGLVTDSGGPAMDDGADGG